MKTRASILGRLIAFSTALIVFVVAGAAIVVMRAGSPQAAAVTVLNDTLGQAVSSDPRPIHFVVRDGETAAQIATDLEAHQLIRNALAFRFVVRFSKVGGRLEAGDYQLRPDMSLTQIISVLAQGRMSGGLVTIPEGWRSDEIGDALQRDQVTNRDEFLQVVDHPNFRLPAALAPFPPGHSLEGFLFPDSYRFGQSDSPSQIAQRMVDDFAQHLTPSLVQGFQANGLTLYQGVILASIVEREAVVPTDRPLIASVYLNRLRRGMRLQADPTVQYALVPVNASTDPPGGYWKRTLTFADLRTNSPYNTYQVVGLPPGPICNPGLASLQAVAAPARTDYLYFVARPDGSHAFSRTLQEQQQNVSKYGS